ncbi:MAG: hypothetical protein ABSG38_04620 [Spirochaetia bacterium]
MSILTSQEHIRHNATRFLFYMLWFVIASILIIGRLWPYTCSFSSDYGTHNSWITSIMRYGHIVSISYPPLAYWLGAVVSKMLGSSVIAMNVITLVSLIVATACLLFIVSKTGAFNAWLSVAVFFLLYTSGSVYPLIGYEVIGNYFYSELVATAYLLVTMSIFFVWRCGFESKLVFSLLVLFVGFFIYPIPVLVFYGATTLLLLLEISKNEFKKLWTWGLYVVLGAIIFLFNPSTRAIMKVADNNGWLSFPLLTRSPIDITLWGIVFIFFALVLSSMVALFDLLRGRNGIQDRVFSLINSTLFSVSGLGAFQFVLMAFGKSNPYSVKKYFFILGTFLIIELLFLFTRGVAYLYRITPDHPQSEVVVLFAPLLAGALFIGHPLADVRGLLKYEAEARFYRQFVGNADSTTFAWFHLPGTFNYLISTADLDIPIDDAWQFYFTDRFSGILHGEPASAFDGSLMIERDWMAKSTIWVGRDVEVVNYKPWIAETMKLDRGRLELFSHSRSQAFLVDGFSSPEPWGIWSDAPRSVMSLVVDPKTDVSLTFKVSPFLPKPGMVLSVSVGANGAKIADWTFKNGEVFPVDKTLMIRKRLVPPEGKINLTFVYSNTNSPASLGVNADSRQLALGFISLTRN